MGSPPHVWRIPMPSTMSGRELGITSTCVENTNANEGQKNGF